MIRPATVSSRPPRAIGGATRRAGLAAGRVSASALALALLSVAVTFLAAGPAAPGAWPREAGGVFLSSGLTAWRRDGLPTVDGSLHAEAGIGRGWMLGADATWKGRGGTDVVVGLGRARLRRGGTALGWAVGIGRRTTPGAPALVYLRPALAWGRGFGRNARLAGRRLPRPGWISAEVQAELWLSPRRIAPKVDLVLGVDLSDRWSVMAELWADAYPGARPSVRLGPAAILRLGRHRLKLQPEIPLAGGGEARLGLALWSEF